MAVSHRSIIKGLLLWTLGNFTFRRHSDISVDMTSSPDYHVSNKSSYLMSRFDSAAGFESETLCAVDLLLINLPLYCCYNIFSTRSPGSMDGWERVDWM